jgi:hypothetical protein
MENVARAMDLSAKAAFENVTASLESVRAAWDSAGVANKTADIMQDTAKRQLRAYVMVTEATIVGADENGTVQISRGPRGEMVNIIVGPGFRSFIQFIVTNTGETPAHNVRIYGRAKLVTWPIRDQDLPELPLSEESISKSVVGRNRTPFKFEVLDILTVEDFARLQNASSAIVAYGEIHYDDVFGEQKITSYRYFAGGAVSINNTTMSAHENGNEAT